MIWECIVIGGGASGLYLASQVNVPNLLVLEKKHKVGLKLGISGGGQCNLTHGGYMNQFYKKYGSQQIKSIKGVLKNHDNKAVIRYFKSLGLETVEREDGKVFPKDFKAQSVISALNRKISLNGVKVNLNESVNTVEKQGDYFKVTSSQNTYLSKRLVIATGGMSYPVLGTEGDGYVLARSLGHQIKALTPGLTGVIIGDHYLRTLSGLSISNITIRLNRTGQVYEGDLLATHFGLSGPVIINNSRDFRDGDVLQMNWVGQSPQAFDQDLLTLIKEHGEKPIAYRVNKLNVPDRLKANVLEKYKIDSTLKIGQMTKETRQKLVEGFTSYPVKIDSLQGFKDAMVTVGGVELSDIDMLSMMSKRHPNLYFIGEVVDVDGDTGGYNLQWAFSSAYTAAQSILSSFHSRDVDTHGGE